MGTALCLAGLAALAVAATPPQVEHAARLSGAAAVLHDTGAARKHPEARDLRAEYARVAGGVRAALDGDARAQTSWREARALSPAQAMRRAAEQYRTSRPAIAES
jgi:hypothetical protein